MSMRSWDLTKRLFLDQPFKPFRVHLDDGATIDVREPRMIIVGRSTAVLPTRWDRDDKGQPIVIDWQTVALRHIVRFTDLAARQNGNRRRKK
jgi:hypothetical protein